MNDIEDAGLRHGSLGPDADELDPTVGERPATGETINPTLELAQDARLNKAESVKPYLHHQGGRPTP